MKTFTLTLVLFMFCSITFAAEEDTISYDNIVDELSQSRASYNEYAVDPFAGVQFHGGIGMIIAMPNIDGTLESGKDVHSKNDSLRGVEVNMGIDLFSRNWIAEGSYRTLSNSNKSDYDFKLNEFDLKVIYKSRVGRLFKMHTGGGLAARYLTYTDSSDGSEYKYTTPASILLLGFGARLSNFIDVNLEASFRNSLVNETIDNSALHAGLRFDAHF